MPLPPSPRGQKANEPGNFAAHATGALRAHLPALWEGQGQGSQAEISLPLLTVGSPLIRFLLSQVTGFFSGLVQSGLKGSQNKQQQQQKMPSSGESKEVTAILWFANRTGAA